MQFLIVLVAALACATAEPQFAYTGYTGGVVPAVGYTGYTGGVVPYAGHQGAVAYSAPLTYSGHAVTYPVGYPVVSRTRRDVPASTTKLESVVPQFAYAHPAAVYPYGAPLVKSATPYTYKAYSPVAYSPVAYSTVGAYPYPQAYGYPGSVVTY